MSRLLRNASIFQRSLSAYEVSGKGLPWTSYQSCRYATKGKRNSKADGSESNEENMSKKELALQQAIDQINESSGKRSIMWLGRSPSPRHVPVVSSGCSALDIALGIGGFPKGRVVEIYGPEASGKTTLSLHVIAEAQKLGGCCAFIDAEHALDPALAESIGVNTQNLLFSQPDCGEQALSLLDMLIRSGSLDVVVVDSVAALVPKAELEGEMGDAHMAMQARLMSQALRKLSHSLSMTQCILIFLNQVRSKISTFGGFAGPNETTCGGNALKFYASMRLHIKSIGFIKKGKETIGSQVLVKVVKNKHAPPFKTAEFAIEFGKGISTESEITELCVKSKLIGKLSPSSNEAKDLLKHAKEEIYPVQLNSHVGIEEEFKVNDEGKKPEDKDGHSVNTLEALGSHLRNEEEFKVNDKGKKLEDKAVHLVNKMEALDSHLRIEEAFRINDKEKKSEGKAAQSVNTMEELGSHLRIEEEFKIDDKGKKSDDKDIHSVNTMKGLGSHLRIKEEFKIDDKGKKSEDKATHLVNTIEALGSNLRIKEEFKIDDNGKKSEDQDIHSVDNPIKGHLRIEEEFKIDNQGKKSEDKAAHSVNMMEALGSSLKMFELHYKGNKSEDKAAHTMEAGNGKGAKGKKCSGKRSDGKRFPSKMVEVTGQCWRCGKLGHVKKDCKSQGKNKGRGILMPVSSLSQGPRKGVRRGGSEWSLHCTQAGPPSTKKA